MKISLEEIRKYCNESTKTKLLHQILQLSVEFQEINIQDK